MSYLIISTIVILVAAVAVVNGIGLRRQGKADEGTAWILASALAVIVVTIALRTVKASERARRYLTV